MYYVYTYICRAFSRGGRREAKLEGRAAWPPSAPRSGCVRACLSVLDSGRCAKATRGPLSSPSGSQAAAPGSFPHLPGDAARPQARKRRRRPERGGARGGSDRASPPPLPGVVAIPLTRGETAHACVRVVGGTRPRVHHSTELHAWLDATYVRGSNSLSALTPALPCRRGPCRSRRTRASRGRSRRGLARW